MVPLDGWQGGGAYRCCISFSLQVINLQSRKFHIGPSKDATPKMSLLLVSRCISPGSTYLHELTKNWCLVKPEACVHTLPRWMGGGQVRGNGR